MVHADEIYNIYKKIQEKFYLKARDQKESVKLWLQELSSQKGYVHDSNPLRYKY
ncbi:hypothetical protein BD408DRAFT_412740 [Parasitella parasitica]|nr:hypothetical protein BD408DRAFT_412740 [Parasitella parasitica]